MIGALLALLPTLAAFSGHASCVNDRFGQGQKCQQGGIVLSIQDRLACVEPAMKRMIFTVKVDGENFGFDPACASGLRESFTTKGLIECSVEAGMCSEFTPKNKIIVKCADKGSVEFVVKCK